nr:hypothetical protein [Tanacetum cinerariifolium]
MLVHQDEPVSPLGDDSQGEACPSVSGFEAEQDRANIIKTYALPSDATPRVTSLAADEGSMQHKFQELIDLCTHLQRQQDEMVSKITAQDLEISTLKARIKLLEDIDGGGDGPSREDATIKGRSLETGEEAASILTSRVQVSVPSAAEVATVSIPSAGEIPTVSVPTGSGMVPTASPIFTTTTVATPYSRRKVLRSHAGWKTKHFKGMSLEEIREKFVPVWKQIKDFVPMGSKEEGERLKRKGIRLEQESAKKVKTSKEVSEEDLKEMMQLVPVKERSSWKIIRLGGSTASYHFFVDMLKHFDREDLNQLWALVKETLNIRQATSDKAKELWVKLKRLYEPDVEDQLWT